jgi:4-hydroxy-3-methylbut-2-en-1-yl diphosphate reductase
MNIHVAEHLGLCFGVRDAIAKAEELAAQGPLTVLGELAHNPHVRERLFRVGIQEGSLSEIGHSTTSRVMVTAHGAAKKSMESWRQAGFDVLDGTCPLVRHAHRELSALVAAGCLPVIIGKHGHPEVVGLSDDHPLTVVVSSVEDLANICEHPHYGVIAQTTQPIAKVMEIVTELRRRHPLSEVTFRDTVCQPTKNRQTALAALLDTCDALVVVGGRGSNNTLELVAAGNFAGLVVHHVEHADELRSEWFVSAQEVGLTAGTSTLQQTIEEVHDRLRDIARQIQAHGVVS